MKIKLRLRGVTSETMWQVIALLITSCCLGFIFNASNPIGIRWSAPSPIASSEFASSSPTSSAPESNNKSNSMLSQVKPVSIPIASSNEVSSNSVLAPTQFVPPTPAFWDEVKSLVDQGRVLLVDARPTAFFEAGHIPKSVNLPEPPSPAEWDAFCKQYSRPTPIVVYCSSTNCSLSFKLANRLAREGGYEFVRYITGGYYEWMRDQALASQGGGVAPKSTNLLSHKPREFPAQEVAPIVPPIAALPSDQKLENALPITWAQTRPLLGLDQAVLLDARSREEFDAGHIPGAISVPADASIETVQQILRQHKSTARLIAYCGSMGCPEAFQLATRLMRELDFPNALFMLDGYAEWRHFQKTASASDKVTP